MHKCEENVNSLNFCIRRFYITPMFMQCMFQILFPIFNASYDYTMDLKNVLSWWLLISSLWTFEISLITFFCLSRTKLYIVGENLHQQVFVVDTKLQLFYLFTLPTCHVRKKHWLLERRFIILAPTFWSLLIHVYFLRFMFYVYFIWFIKVGGWWKGTHDKNY